MNDTPKYYIAQMVPDLFRREPVNVGVFVQKDGRIAARFFGEKSPGGDIDGRKIKGFPAPSVYVQWVEFWRRMIVAKSNDPIRDLMEPNGYNYNIISGGEVDNTERDSPEDIANYLYPLLVSTGGLQEALGFLEDTAEESMTKLRDAIDDEFATNNILWNTDRLYRVAHPIYKSKEVAGKTTVHRPSYVQENGTLWIMEAVDFTTARKEWAKDHAGCAAFMFGDIKTAAGASKVQAISIVKIRREDTGNEFVSRGMDMLKSTSQEIVNWNDPKEQSAFVQKRVEIALADPQ